MAESLGEAVLELRTDDSKLDAGIERARSKTEGLASRFESVGSKMQDVGAKLSLGVTTPLVAFGVASTRAAMESAEAIGQVDAALASMGNGAGRTREQLEALAEKQMSNSLYDDDEILRKVTANLLTFGNVSGQAFDRGQQAAIDMAARLGTDLQGATLMVGKALNDPVAGITALTRTGVQFTDQQKEQIKAMTEAGDRAGAQKMILAELERQFGGSAKAMRDADPSAAMKQAFATFQEDVGSKILPMLPPITNAIAGVLGAFSALPSPVQTSIVALAAAGAAFGPLLLGVGSLARGIGLLIPLMTGLGPVITVVRTALFGLLANPIVLGAAAVIFAIYQAWKHWDDIAPIISAVAAAITEWWNANVKPVLDAVGVAIDAVVGWFAGLPGKIGGSLSAAYTAVKTWLQDKLGPVFNFVGDAITRAIGFYSDLAKRGIESVQNLYTGVKQWVQDRLGAVFEWLRKKLEAVGGYFFDLYDKVVGHSYVPDMVDGVSDHFGRLQPEMVDPAKQATEAVGQSFADMASSAIGSLDSMIGKLKGGDFLGAMQDAIGLIGQVGGMLTSVGDTGGAGGFLTGIAKTLGPIFGGGSFAGGFATGGMIPAGTWGIVGERGPEPIVSTKSGALVHPNSTLRDGRSGGGSVTINFNGPVSNAAEVRRSAAQAGAALSRQLAAGQRGI